jgi:hypothetical protein
MTHCPSCSRATPDGVHFCPSCGAKLTTDSFVAARLIEGAADPTPEADPAPEKDGGAAREAGRAPSSSDSLGRVRFVAGTVLADRYRIITLVGRDLLVGAAAGMAACVLIQLQDLLPLWAGLVPNAPYPISGVQMTLTARGFLPYLMNQIDASLAFTFMGAFVLLFLSMLLRSSRYGIAAGCLLMTATTVLLSSHKPPASWPFAAAAMITYVVVLVRFGVLTAASALLFRHLTVFFPFTTELSAWYATTFILDAAFLLAVACYAFHTSLGGHPFFRRGLLEE